MYYNKVEISGMNTSDLCVLDDDEKRELLLRVKAGDGKAREELIYGNLSSEKIPMPDMESIKACENAFENWRASGFHVPPKQMTRQMTVNSILLLIRRFLMLERGIIEFDKRKMIPLYLAYQPPMVSPLYLNAVESYLSDGESAIDDSLLLEMSLWHEDLLSFMNHRLLNR